MKSSLRYPHISIQFLIRPQVKQEVASLAGVRGFSHFITNLIIKSELDLLMQIQDKKTEGKKTIRAIYLFRFYSCICVQD